MPEPRILIVEDEGAVADLIGRYLRHSGYQIAGAVGTGEEALAQIASLQPDLLLMDIALGGELDGVQTAELVSARFDLPVVFLTGMADDTTIQRSQSSRAFGYVLKPFRQEDLKSSIDLALSKHEVESQLRQVERWFGAAIKSIRDGVITTDRQRAVTFLNPVAETLTGWKLVGARGRPLEEVFAVPAPIAEEPVTHHAMLSAREGTQLPVEYNLAPIRNDAGAAVGTVLVFRDITERKLAEERLAQSEARLRAIFDTEPECVKLLARDGTVLEMNPAGLAMLEADSAAQVIGLCPSPLIAPEDRPAFQALVERVFRGESGRLEFSVIGLKGTRRRLESHAVPLRTREGGVAALLAVTHDVTEQKRAEAELSRSRDQLRSLAAYLQSIREEERARISREVHDQLGQMLTGLRMDVAWLEKRIAALDAKTRVPLAKKHQSMFDLLDQMVKTVRRISADLRPGVLDDLGLGPALEWQAREWQERTGIECEVQAALRESAVPPELGTALFRIFQEALTNAARHARATRVTAELRAEAGAVRLEVRDNGVGYAADERRHPNSLGLLGMKERAAILGGQFHITGAAGQGTTVTVTIPLPPFQP